MRKFTIVAMLTAALAATPLMARQPAQSGLQNDAPDRYVVVKGDTLWSIATKFLKDPWRWPEVWKLNQQELKNPHLIYPGDVIVLNRSGQNPELRIEMGSTERLEAHVRIEDTGRQAIPSI